jgi:hypothetical protein
VKVSPVITAPIWSATVEEITVMPMPVSTRKRYRRSAIAAGTRTRCLSRSKPTVAI